MWDEPLLPASKISPLEPTRSLRPCVKNETHVVTKAVAQARQKLSSGDELTPEEQALLEQQEARENAALAARSMPLDW